MSDLPWLKLYTEALHDPKFIVAATDNQMDEMTVFGIWMALLCIAARSPVRGSLIASNRRNFTIEQLDAIIGWRGNMGTGDLSSLMQSFIDLDMIAIDEQGAYYIVNFEERQETKEEHTKRLNRERQKRYQESHQFDESISDSVINNVINNAPLTQDSISISTSISDSLINPINNEFAEIYKLFNDNVQFLTPLTAEALGDDIKEYGGDWVKDAITVAVENNARNLAYIEAVLKNRKAGKSFVKNGKGKAKVSVDRTTEEARNRYGEWEQ